MENDPVLTYEIGTYTGQQYVIMYSGDHRSWFQQYKRVFSFYSEDGPKLVSRMKNWIIV